MMASCRQVALNYKDGCKGQGGEEDKSDWELATRERTHRDRFAAVLRQFVTFCFDLLQTAFHKNEFQTEKFTREKGS
jgi:hypothetical protein